MSGKTHTEPLSDAFGTSNIGAIHKKRVSIRRSILTYRTFPKLTERALAPEITSLQAVIDGSPAAILREMQRDERYSCVKG